MRNRLAMAAATALLCGVGAAVAQQLPANPDPSKVRSASYVLDKSHAKLNWGVSHFGFSTYTGEFTDFDARLRLDARAPERSNLAVRVNTASVETNDDKLDEHLRSADFFDVAKHPSASFQSTRVEVTGPRSARVFGNLTMLGRTRPLALEVAFNGAGENPVSKTYTVGFSAEGTIRRSEYGMTTFVPGIGDDVKLTISGEFTPEPRS